MNNRLRFGRKPDPAESEPLRRALDAIASGAPIADEVDRFSNLNRASVAALREQWATLPVRLRGDLVDAWIQAADREPTYNFDRAASVALHDVHPAVRAAALGFLEDDDAPELCGALMELVVDEADPALRHHMLDVLGKFAMRMELGEFDDSGSDDLHQVLLTVAEQHDDRSTRRHALAALSYFSESDDVVALILRGYDSGEIDEMIAAVRAMGCQCDERWLELLHDELWSDDTEMRVAAAQAIGGIASPSSLPYLIEALEENESEVRVEIATALGEIGDTASRRLLNALTDDDDPLVAAAALEQLDALSLTPSSDLPLP